MHLRFFLFFLFFFIYSLNLYADKKEMIINKLLKIDNLTFSFKQITNNKTETGTCFLVFDNKLKCNYLDKNQKEIIINNKTLVIMQKRYDKIYFYPISKSPLVKILNKKSLIKLIRNSNVELNDNIDMIYLDENKKNITVSFQKENYDLIGWEVEDQFQNKNFFSLKVQNTNTKINENLFKIPSIN